MWSLKDLVKHSKNVLTEVSPGKWVPARPLGSPWWWRVKDAWAVLCGKADAFKWPEGQ